MADTEIAREIGDAEALREAIANPELRPRDEGIGCGRERPRLRSRRLACGKAASEGQRKGLGEHPRAPRRAFRIAAACPEMAAPAADIFGIALPPPTQTPQRTQQPRTARPRSPFNTPLGPHVPAP